MNTEAGVSRCVLRKSDRAVLLRARPEQVQRLEGNWYFHPDTIDPARFEVSSRTYTCPKKGVCNWVDLKTDKSYINDVAWVYPSALPGFEHIAGWYGFYPEHNHYCVSECD